MLGLEQLQNLWSNLLALGTKRLAALGLVGLAVFASVGFGSFYLSRSDYDTLYAGLTGQDVSRIGAVLKEAGINFDVNAPNSKFTSAGFDLTIPDGAAPGVDLVLSPLPVPDPTFPAHSHCANLQ